MKGTASLDRSTFGVGHWTVEQAGLGAVSRGSAFRFEGAASGRRRGCDARERPGQRRAARSRSHRRREPVINTAARLPSPTLRPPHRRRLPASLAQRCRRKTTHQPPHSRTRHALQLRRYPRSFRCRCAADSCNPGRSRFLPDGRMLVTRSDPAGSGSLPAMACSPAHRRTCRRSRRLPPKGCTMSCSTRSSRGNRLL